LNILSTSSFLVGSKKVFGLVNGRGFLWGQFADPVPTLCQSHPVSWGTGFVKYSEGQNCSNRIALFKDLEISFEGKGFRT